MDSRYLHAVGPVGDTELESKWKLPWLCGVETRGGRRDEVVSCSGSDVRKLPVKSGNTVGDEDAIGSQIPEADGNVEAFEAKFETRGAETLSVLGRRWVTTGLGASLTPTTRRVCYPTVPCRRVLWHWGHRWTSPSNWRRVQRFLCLGNQCLARGRSPGWWTTRRGRQRARTGRRAASWSKQWHGMAEAAGGNAGVFMSFRSFEAIDEAGCGSRVAGSRGAANQSRGAEFLRRAIAIDQCCGRGRRRASVPNQAAARAWAACTGGGRGGRGRGESSRLLGSSGCLVFGATSIYVYTHPVPSAILPQPAPHRPRPRRRRHTPRCPAHRVLGPCPTMVLLRWCDVLLRPRLSTGPLAERSPAPPPAPADCPLAAGQLVIARCVACLQPGSSPPGSLQPAGAQRPLRPSNVLHPAAMAGCERALSCS